MMWPASAALRDAVQSSAYHPWRSRTPDTLRTDWRYLMNYLNPAGLVRTKLKDADFPKKMKRMQHWRPHLCWARTQPWSRESHCFPTLVISVGENTSKTSSSRYIPIPSWVLANLGSTLLWFSRNLYWIPIWYFMIFHNHPPNLSPSSLAVIHESFLAMYIYIENTILPWCSPIFPGQL